MRALLMDKNDESLVAIEVYEALYDREEGELCLYGSESIYTVENVSEYEAQIFIKLLFENGKADLARYPAYCMEYDE